MLDGECVVLTGDFVQKAIGAARGARGASAKTGLWCRPRIAALPKTAFGVGQPCQNRPSVAAKCRFGPSCEDRSRGTGWPRRAYLGFCAGSAVGSSAGATPEAIFGAPGLHRGPKTAIRCNGRSILASPDYTEGRFWQRRGAPPTPKPDFGSGEGRRLHGSPVLAAGSLSRLHGRVVLASAYE